MNNNIRTIKEDSLSKIKKSISIYKKTKVKRIKNKNYKKAKKMLFDEMDNLIMLAIERQFENFASIEDIRFNDNADEGV